MNFTQGMWVSTSPKKWIFDSVNDILHIIISLEDKRYIMEYSFSKNLFKDISDPYHNFINYEEIKKDISILIPAYDVVDYIDETLNMFYQIGEKYPYLNIKILIGVDGCEKTFKHISKKVYPENTTVLLSEKNYGEPIMKNNLVHYCETEKFIIFDSDDIPKENFVNYIWDKLEKCDTVHYRSINFIDKVQTIHDDNLEISGSVWGGTFGSKKSIFLSMNGFYPWRVQSDDEFLHRIIGKIDSNKRCVCEEPMFYYRIRSNSSSRDKQTNKNSFLRKCYIDLMTEKNVNKTFENPNRFYYKKLIYIQ
jgi:cellulose synthase/poly-beta-1,6-N-acetylglucosamine synthase-like glycosyltransferase